MEKTQKEHTQYREAVSKAAAKAKYPTEQMLSDVRQELEQVKFAYLPDGRPQLPEENKDKVTIDELD